MRCLTLDRLISLCMPTTKTLKRLLDYASDQALPEDICSIVIYEINRLVSHVLHALLRPLTFVPGVRFNLK